MIIDQIIAKQQKLQSAIDALLQYQEVAVVEHYYRIKSMARAKQAKQFVSFDSRDQVIDQSLDALLSGEHVLME